MGCLVAIAFLLSGVAASDNLLSNADFEILDRAGMPLHWDLFVMPMQGAFGEADDRPLDGDFSITLYNPKPYDEEPANNWSQTLIGDFSEKKLRFTGHLRTEDADEAAVWIQCFQRQPLRVLSGATTSQDAPLSGTTEWTPVEISITPPKGTDFIVVRCVIRGAGRAWFDSLQLTATSNPNNDDEEKKEIEILEPTDDLKTAPGVIENEMARISADMQSTIDDVNSSNRLLREEIQALHNELAAFKQELKTTVANTLQQSESRDRTAMDERQPLLPLNNGHILIPRLPEGGR